MMIMRFAAPLHGQWNSAVLSSTQAASVKEAREHISLHAPNYAVLDLKLEDGNGLEIVALLRQCIPNAGLLF